MLFSGLITAIWKNTIGSSGMSLKKNKQQKNEYSIAGYEHIKLYLVHTNYTIFLNSS